MNTNKTNISFHKKTVCVLGEVAERDRVATSGCGGERGDDVEGTGEGECCTGTDGGRISRPRRGDDAVEDSDCAGETDDFDDLGEDTLRLRSEEVDFSGAVREASVVRPIFKPASIRRLRL